MRITHIISSWNLPLLISISTIAPTILPIFNSISLKLLTHPPANSPSNSHYSSQDSSGSSPDPKSASLSSSPWNLPNSPFAPDYHHHRPDHHSWDSQTDRHHSQDHSNRINRQDNPNHSDASNIPAIRIFHFLWTIATHHISINAKACQSSQISISKQSPAITNLGKM